MKSVTTNNNRQSHDSSNVNGKHMRLLSLDAFRGIAVFMMIIVNTPGSWKDSYSCLHHADWQGCTIADVIFPFFLFIMGTASSVSLSRCSCYTIDSYHTRLLQICKRTFLLFFLGLLLNVFSYSIHWLFYNPELHFVNIRIMGVLQRISITYFLCSLCFIYLSPRKLVSLSIAILCIYWVIITAASFPGSEKNSFSGDANVALYIDTFILSPQHMLFPGKTDPEGLLSTIPALATVINGFLSGYFFVRLPKQSSTSLKMVTGGAGLLASGYLWSNLFPICKDLWTSSYVLVTSGYALLVMACCFECIEVRKCKLLFKPFIIGGRYSLFLFVASGILMRLLANITINFHGEAKTIWSCLTEITTDMLFGSSAVGSFMITCIYVLFWWYILNCMYNKSCFSTGSV